MCIISFTWLSSCYMYIILQPSAVTILQQCLLSSNALCSFIFLSSKRLLFLYKVINSSKEETLSSIYLSLPCFLHIDLSSETFLRPQWPAVAYLCGFISSHIGHPPPVPEYALLSPSLCFLLFLGCTVFLSLPFQIFLIFKGPLRILSPVSLQCLCR